MKFIYPILLVLYSGVGFSQINSFEEFPFIKEANPPLMTIDRLQILNDLHLPAFKNKLSIINQKIQEDGIVFNNHKCFMLIQQNGKGKTSEMPQAYVDPALRFQMPNPLIKEHAVRPTPLSIEPAQ
jgi:hypothetical protein